MEVLHFNKTCAIPCTGFNYANIPKSSSIFNSLFLSCCPITAPIMPIEQFPTRKHILFMPKLQKCLCKALRHFLIPVLNLPYSPSQTILLFFLLSLIPFYLFLSAKNFWCTYNFGKYQQKKDDDDNLYHQINKGKKKRRKKRRRGFEDCKYRLHYTCKIYRAADLCHIFYLICKNCFMWIAGTFW